MNASNQLKKLSRYKDELQNVRINDAAIESFAASLLTQSIAQEHGFEFVSYKFDNDYHKYFQFMLIFNALNFCYWAEKHKQKWQIKFQGEILDGSIALVRALENWAKTTSAFWDWHYLASVEKAEFAQVLAGIDMPIPLLDERYEQLTNLAQEILSRFDGSSDVIIAEAQNCASRMLNVLSSMVTFQDGSLYRGDNINFWKRAQLQIKMYSDFKHQVGAGKLRNLHILTAFADYKIPQLLRHLHMISYTDTLAEMIDNYVLIEKDSEMENEIRLATVIAVERIKTAVQAKGGTINAADIDNMLWDRAAANTDPMKPYHRTYTRAY